MTGTPFSSMRLPGQAAAAGSRPAARPQAREDAAQRPLSQPARPVAGLGRLGALRTAEAERPEDHHPAPAEPQSQEPSGHAASQRVEGQVVRMIFHASDSGYAVYVIKAKEGEFTLSVTSTVKHAPGDRIVALGEWGQYKGKKTFKAAAIMHDVPKGAKGVVHWLKSSAVKDVGKRTAEKLARHFGDRLEQVIDDADALEEAGIPRKRAEAIVEAWLSNASQPETVVFLAKYGLGTRIISKVIARYGAAAKRVIDENPWILCETIDGIGFQTADRIALEHGHPKDSPARMRAALRHVLTSRTRSEGHCGLPKAELVDGTASLLKLPQEKIQSHLGSMFEGYGYEFDEEVGLVYESSVLSDERRLAERIAAMANGEGRCFLSIPAAEDAVDKAAQEIGIPLDPSQRTAAVTALTNGLSVTTGGPGTGKSTIQEVIARVLAWFDRDFALASPTGRAAKRLAECTKMPASTFHRLLQFSAEKGGFEYDRENPLPEDWLDADEVSMVDLRIGACVFDALDDAACATLVGDVDQLPSVGRGQVLRDIIESGIVKVSRLTVPHRQSKDSGIIPAAHRINAGLHPIQDPSEDLSGFEIHDMSDPEAMVEKVVRLVRDELPERGIDPMRDVQVLASMKPGTVGVHALNEHIKRALNPWQQDDGNSIEIMQRRFSVGDRVMHLRNDYIKGVYNGEVGTISWVGYARNEDGGHEGVVKVDYSGYEARYSPSDIDDIEQAWAATVHKSQGCEFPVVLFLCPYEHRRMLNRNLFYTAVTRAKKLCYVIGDDSAVQHAVDTNDVTRRWTGLSQRIRWAASALPPPPDPFQDDVAFAA